MKITKSQWFKLEQLAQAVHDARRAFDDGLLDVIKQFDSASPEAQLLLKQLADEETPVPYRYHCQEEWTGGDSLDPKNFQYREPALVGNFPQPIK